MFTDVSKARHRFFEAIKNPNTHCGIISANDKNSWLTQIAALHEYKQRYCLCQAYTTNYLVIPFCSQISWNILSYYEAVGMLNLEISLEHCPESMIGHFRRSGLGTYKARKAFEYVNSQLQDYPTRSNSRTHHTLENLQTWLMESFSNGFNWELSNKAIQELIMHRCGIVGLKLLTYVFIESSITE